MSESAKPPLPIPPPRLAKEAPANLSPEEIDEFWMEQALKLASYAEELGEVPVGAVLVQDNKLISTGYNQPILNNDPTAHAEVMALREGGVVLQNYRLPNTTLYVTLEPCAMCASALVHARVKRLVFGALDERTGAAGGLLNLVEFAGFNHQLEVKSGILLEKCAKQLREFFISRRKRSEAGKT